MVLAILERINETLVDLISGFQRKNLDKVGEKVVISSYLDPDLILFMEEEDRDTAIKKLTHKLLLSGKIQDEESFYSAVIQREKIVSTGVGMGVAIPHAKLDDYKDFFIAIGVQKDKGIEWQSLDGSLVQLIFLIGGPSKDQTKYLKILSRLTASIKDETLRNAVMKSTNADEIISLFTQYDSQES